MSLVGVPLTLLVLRRHQCSEVWCNGGDEALRKCGAEVGVVVMT